MASPLKWPRTIEEPSKGGNPGDEGARPRSSRPFRRVWLALAAPASAVVESASDRLRARDGARFVLETHCGDCHRPHSLRALPRALAMFDLSEPEWDARLTDAERACSRAWRGVTTSDEPLAARRTGGASSQRTSEGLGSW